LKLLLDTHLILWWLMDSPALPDEARTLIGDAETTVFMSAVSMWEIWLKQSLGKLRLPSNFEAGLAEEMFENLPFTAEQARQVALLPWHHRDPFDRMLVAQAKREQLTLLTADAIVGTYGEYVRVVH
jgi:PIN domain nuclease of toxin-antitoxin system